MSNEPVERNYPVELRTIIEATDKYFDDPEEKKIGNVTLSQWNTTLLMLSYVMNSNSLLVGEPGFAKTTAAKVVSCVMSGYPFDLYEAAQIQGHADQTFETMLARLDYARLKEKESVIWLLAAYLPVRIFDELPRLKFGNQDQILNFVETGRLSYLNSTFYIGRTPFFATANHPYNGHNVLDAALRDRFSVHQELGYTGSARIKFIEAAEEHIEQDLKDEESTNTIIDIINDSQWTVKERLEKIKKVREPFTISLRQKLGVSTFETEDRKAIMGEIKKVPLSEEADIFLQMIFAEFNHVPKLGRKRSNDDPMDGIEENPETHAQYYAHSKIKNSLSPRGIIRGLKRYSQALAYLNNQPAVQKEHLLGVAPYVLGHRLDFTDDFKSQYVDKERPGMFGMSKEMFFAHKVMEGIEENHLGTEKRPGVESDLNLLVMAYKKPERISETNWQHIKGMLELRKKNQDDLHPLLHEYLDLLLTDEKFRKKVE